MLDQWIGARTPWELLAGAALIALSVGSVIRLATLGGCSPEKRRGHLGSLRTWWILLLMLLAASALGPWGVSLLLAGAGAIALDEFLRLTTPDLPRGVRRVWIAVLVLTNYALIVAAPNFDSRPVVVLLIGWSLVIPHLISDSPRRYLEHVGHALWGALVLVWGVGHAAWLVARDIPGDDLETRVGWFLLLVILTEFNDIFQALIGRAIGKHRILPTVSPHKTWEGFLGGMLFTIIAAGALQSVLRLRPLANQEIDQPYPLLAMLGAAAVVAISGFVGDLNISCVKRDKGVKDGSTLLPGQGGMVDRIDSLSFTAPALVLWTTLV